MRSGPGGKWDAGSGTRPTQTNYKKVKKYYGRQQPGASNSNNVILHYFYVPVKKPASAGMAKRFVVFSGNFIIKKSLEFFYFIFTIRIKQCRI
jgi:hypothetical protein